MTTALHPTALPGAAYSFSAKTEAVAAGYRVLLDTLRNGAYGGVYDTISGYVIDLTWQAGMQSAYEEVARPGRLQITIDNHTGDFTPDQYGDETVSNGNFTTWTGGDPDDWPVTGESGSDPEISEVGPTMGHGEGGTGLCNLYTSDGGSPVSISQDVLTPGERHQITIYLDTRKSGAVVVKDGDTVVSHLLQTPGVKTLSFVAASSTLKIETWGAADVTIGSVSCKTANRYGGILTPGTLVKVVYGSTQLYEGLIRSVSPTVGQYGPQYDGRKPITVVVEDAMQELLDADYSPSLLLETTIDQALEELFDRATIPYPYAAGYWILGVEGASELGRTTKLWNNLATEFDTGSTTLAFIGDNLDQGRGVNAQRVIRELVATEFGGRFFFQPRTNKFTFHSRRRDMLNLTPVAAFDAGDLVAAQPSYGDDLANHVTVDFEPRAVGAAGTVLWTETSVPITLRTGERKTIKIRYHDPDNEQASIGAQEVLPLARGLDIIANRLAEGSGQDVSSYVNSTLQAGGGSAELTIWSRARVTIYVTHLQLRGTPILRYPRKSAVATDGDSMRRFNQHRKPPVSVPALSSETQAEAAARWLIGKFKNPVLRLVSVQMVVDNRSANLADVLARTIGDRITVSEAWSGHEQDYFIVGEQHQIAGGGDDVHRVTWVLKPASREQYWILGQAGFTELGSTTRLAF